ncbi:BPSS1780 family membrane protein [Pseudoalteromonas mariniglutinosa]|uniref:BPSS1780 family membrane protein n=1 Tax=Pseudoalteromonas mariniglutinosa TaxID=206042 RepID=UPI00384E6FCD
MSIELRVFKADAGVKWLKAGWLIFKSQPVTFIFMYLFIAVVGLLSVLLPVLQIIASLAMPFLIAGFYQAVITKQQGGVISQLDIFKPFSNKGNRMGLVRVALYKMAAGLLLAFLSNSLFSDAISVLTQTGFNPQNAEHIERLVATLSMSHIALFLVAFSVYLTAFAYAVPLVYFSRQKNILAVLKTSFVVFYHNIAPLTVYGIIVVFLMLACVPLSFIPLLVLMPICYISFFISFQAIFMPIVPAGGHSQLSESSSTDTGRFDA